MALNITTHYKQLLTSSMLNKKIETVVGGNAIIEGFEVARQGDNISISSGKCIINGAIIENDEAITLEIPEELKNSSQFKVVAKYIHPAKTVEFYACDSNKSLEDNILVLAEVSSQVTNSDKLRLLSDLTSSLKFVKETLKEDQVLEYEGEYLTSKDSIESVTSELKIKGQTVLNVAPIKNEVDMYADLQNTGNTNVKFDNTGDGIIDGINVKGKTYQNLVTTDIENYKHIPGSLTIEDNYLKLSAIGDWAHCYLRKAKMTPQFKAATTYTIILDIVENTINAGCFMLNEQLLSPSLESCTSTYTGRIDPGVTGRLVYVIKTLDDISPYAIALRSFLTDTATEGHIKFRYMIFEGDYSQDTDLPPYFEGIAGVGDKSKNLLNVKKATAYNGATIAYNNGLLKVAGLTNRSWTGAGIKINHLLKPSTTYTLSGLIVNANNAPDAYVEIVDNVTSTRYVSPVTAGKCNVTFKTPSTISDDVSINFMTARETYRDSQEAHFINFQLEENVNATEYEEYYHGYKIKVKSTGKNLFNDSWKVGGFNKQTGAFQENATWVRNEKFIPIKKGVNYRFSNDGEARPTNVFHYDSSKRIIQYKLAVSSFSTDLDNTYIRLAGNPDKRDKFQIEEGTEVTAYEEYKESVVTHILNEPLMSLPNGVCDEIVGNKVIKRVAKIILDGSLEWNDNGTSENLDTLLCWVKSAPYNALIDRLIPISDKLPGISVVTGLQNFEFVAQYQFNNEGYFYLNILKSKLSSADVTGFKEYLKANPVTMYYQLAEPIITPVDNDLILPNMVHDLAVGDKVIRKIKKKILTGDETWYLASQGTDTVVFNTSIKDVLDGTSSICNGLLHTSKVSKSDRCFNILATALYIRVLVSDLPTVTVDNFKEWLKSQDLVVWYEYKDCFETPIDNDNIIFPNGVKDEYVGGNTALRKVKKVVLTGNERWYIGQQGTSTTHSYFVYTPEPKVKVPGVSECNVYSDKFMAVQPDQYNYNKEMVYSWYANNKIYFHIANSRLESVTEEGFKKWLSQNPVTLWYELLDAYEEEIKSPKLNSYSSLTNIFGDTKIPTPLNIESYGYRKRALIKPNTQYTVYFKTDYVNQNYNTVKIDLGGTKKSITFGMPTVTLTTPTTLLHDELRISGYGMKVSEVMCMEGSSYLDFIDGITGSGDNISDLVKPYKIQISSMYKNLWNHKKNYANGYIAARTGEILPPDSKNRTSPFIPVVSNSDYTYITTVDVNSSSHPISWNAVAWYDENKKYITRSVKTGAGMGLDTVIYTLRSPVNAKFARIGSRYLEDELSQVTFCQGVVNEHIPYEDDTIKVLLQEPLRSLPGGTCDTIEKIDGQYVIVRRCGEVLLDGSENWRKNTDLDGTETVFFYTGQEGMSAEWVTPYCDKFVTTSDRMPAVRGNKEVCMSGDGNNPLIQILINSSKLADSSVKSFTEWLSQNPVKVIYKLATPTMHPIDAVKLPNGTCDEIQDGKRIRKVGKLVLDGSETWYAASENNTDTHIQFNYSLGGIKSESLLCDNIEVNQKAMTIINEEGICYSSKYSVFVIRITKSKLETPDIDGFKKWLSENPTTVWYELEAQTEEEYISPDLNVDVYDGITHIMSDTKVPAVINAKIPTNIGTVIKTDIERLEIIEDWIDKVILPSLVESHYQKTLLEFDYEVSMMLQ